MLSLKKVAAIELLPKNQNYMKSAANNVIITLSNIQQCVYVSPTGLCLLLTKGPLTAAINISHVLLYDSVVVIVPAVNNNTV